MNNYIDFIIICIRLFLLRKSYFDELSQRPFIQTRQGILWNLLQEAISRNIVPAIEITKIDSIIQVKINKNVYKRMALNFFNQDNIPSKNCINSTDKDEISIYKDESNSNTDISTNNVSNSPYDLKLNKEKEFIPTISISNSSEDSLSINRFVIVNPNNYDKEILESICKNNTNNGDRINYTNRKISLYSTTSRVDIDYLEKCIKEAIYLGNNDNS